MNLGPWNGLLGALVSMAGTLAAIGAPIADAYAPPDGLPLALSWSAPEGCPTVDAERDEIRRRVGPLDPAHAARPITAQVEIRATAAGAFELSLHTQVGTTTGERTLDGPDCGQLSEAAALVLALLINPDATLGPAPAPPPPPPPTPPPPPPAPVPVFQPRFVAGLDGVLAARVLPGLAQGMGLRFLAGRGRFAGMAQAGGFLPQDTTAALLPGARASFYRLEAALAACAQTLAGGRWGGTACAGAAVVRMHGESAGVSNPGQTAAVWPEALVELSGHLVLAKHARLRLSVEGRGLGSAPDFAILGLGNVYRPPATSLRGALGIDVPF